MGSRPNTVPTLGHLIRSRRLRLDLSQRAAADAAGISLATWQTLERQETTTRFQDLTLTRAATALGLPTGEVFAAAGRPTPRVPDTPPSQPRTTHAIQPPVDGMVTELTARLRALAERSPKEFMLLHRIITDLADHFLHQGPQPDR